MDGLVGVPLPKLLGTTINVGTEFYLLAVLTAAAVCLGLYQLVQSPFGRTLGAIRVNEDRAACDGQRPRPDDRGRLGDRRQHLRSHAVTDLCPGHRMPVTDDVARQVMLDAGMPAYLIEALLPFGEVVRSGRAAEAFQTVEQVTGRPALTFGEWAREHAAAFR